MGPFSLVLCSQGSLHLWIDIFPCDVPAPPQLTSSLDSQSGECSGPWGRHMAGGCPSGGLQ